MKISPVISTNGLAEIINNKNVVLIDAGSGKHAYERYLQKHIENAFYVDLNEDLAEIPDDAKNGGRHPLPSPEKFAEVLQRVGIKENSHLIVYDDKNGSNAAARFWWMARAAGLENVQVLDGGLQQTEKFGLPITQKIPVADEVELIKFKNWELPVINLDQIESFVSAESNILVDVRETERYNGETEPIDLVAGHIPGAINLPFKNNLAENGFFRKPEELKKQFQDVFGNVNSIAVHCGSGVTACHTILAMDYAGLPIPTLYVGSWSEYSRNNKPIATQPRK